MSRIKLKWQWKQQNMEGTIKDCEYVYDRDYGERYWPSSCYYESEEAACAYLESLLDLNVSGVEFGDYVLVKVLYSTGD